MKPGSGIPIAAALVIAFASLGSSRVAWAENGCSQDQDALANLEDSERSLDPTVQAMKLRDDARLAARIQMKNENPWNCDDFQWIDKGHIVSEAPGFTHEQIPHGMYEASYSGSCTLDWPDAESRGFKITDAMVLNDFLNARILRGPIPDRFEDGTPARKYSIRKHEPDDKNVSFDEFTTVRIGFDPSTQTLRFEERLDHVEAPPNAHGGLVRKHDSDFRVSKVIRNGRPTLLLSSDMTTWGAVPGGATGIFMKHAMGMVDKIISKDFLDWREDAMQTFLEGCTRN